MKKFYSIILVIVCLLSINCFAADELTHNQAVKYDVIKGWEDIISYVGTEGVDWHYSYGYEDITKEESVMADYVELSFDASTGFDEVVIYLQIRDGNYYNVIQCSYKVRAINTRIINYAKSLLNNGTIEAIGIEAYAKREYDKYVEYSDRDYLRATVRTAEQFDAVYAVAKEQYLN